MDAESKVIMDGFDMVVLNVHRARRNGKNIRKNIKIGEIQKIHKCINPHSYPLKGGVM